jgi:hypothetical protein
MTEVAGTVKQVGQGLTQKTYKYDALGSLVDVITNAAGTFIIPISLLVHYLRPLQAKSFKLWYRSRNQEVVVALAEEAPHPAQFAHLALRCQSPFPTGRVCLRALRRLPIVLAVV